MAWLKHGGNEPGHHEDDPDRPEYPKGRRLFDENYEPTGWGEYGENGENYIFTTVLPALRNLALDASVGAVSGMLIGGVVFTVSGATLGAVSGTVMRVVAGIVSARKVDQDLAQRGIYDGELDPDEATEGVIDEYARKFFRQE